MSLAEILVFDEEPTGNYTFQRQSSFVSHCSASPSVSPTPPIPSSARAARMRDVGNLQMEQQRQVRKQKSTAPPARSSSDPQKRCVPCSAYQPHQPVPHSTDGKLVGLPAYCYPSSAVEVWEPRRGSVGDEDKYNDDSDNDDDDYEKIDDSQIDSTATQSNVSSPQTDGVQLATERPQREARFVPNKESSSDDDDDAYDDCLCLDPFIVKRPAGAPAMTVITTPARKTTNGENVKMSPDSLSRHNFGRKFEVVMDDNFNFSHVMQVNDEVLSRLKQQQQQQQPVAGGKRAQDADGPAGRAFNNGRRNRSQSSSRILDNSSISAASFSDENNNGINIANNTQKGRGHPAIRSRVQSPESAVRMHTASRRQRNDAVTFSSPSPRPGARNELQPGEITSSPDASPVDRRVDTQKQRTCAEPRAPRASRRDRAVGDMPQTCVASPTSARSRSYDLLREQRPHLENASNRKTADDAVPVWAETTAPVPLELRRRPPPPPPLTATVIPWRRSEEEEDRKFCHEDKVWKAWKTPGDVPSDADFRLFSVEQVAHCVDLLNIVEHLGDAFRQQGVDGGTLVDWLAGSTTVLADSFSCRMFDICKLTLFVLDGWRPKLN
jgi:hypothetical protein